MEHSSKAIVGQNSLYLSTFVGVLLNVITAVDNLLYNHTLQSFINLLIAVVQFLLFRCFVTLFIQLTECVIGDICLIDLKESMNLNLFRNRSISRRLSFALTVQHIILVTIIFICVFLVLCFDWNFSTSLFGIALWLLLLNLYSRGLKSLEAYICDRISASLIRDNQNLCSFVVYTLIIILFIYCIWEMYNILKSEKNSPTFIEIENFIVLLLTVITIILYHINVMLYKTHPSIVSQITDNIITRLSKELIVARRNKAVPD